MNKRGMSQIVTTVIIVVLVLVAIGIVWGVVSNLISESSEDVSLGKFIINLDIQSAYKDGNNVIVNVKRLAGKGDLTGIKFIFSDGSNSELFEEEVTLEELEQDTFTFTPILLDIDEIETVEIAPIYSTGAGADTLGDVSDSIAVGDSAPNGGACVPDCDGKLCGDDGCGSVCGTCEEPTPDCGPEFTCVESCTPVTCVSAGYDCGTPSDECGDYLDCGTCGGGEFCNAAYQCEAIVSNLTGAVVGLTWPPGLATYLDSADLPVFENYRDYYILMTTGTAQTACYLIYDYIQPIEPETYNYSHVRLGVTTSTGILSGDLFDIWPDFDSCYSASLLI